MADADKQPGTNPFVGTGAAYLGGLKDGILPAIVLIGSMTGFGSMARESGVDMAVAVISSASVWGLPGQIAMVELYALGVPLLAIAVAVGGANMRFMPMGISMLPLFQGAVKRWAWCYPLIHLMSISIWAVFMRRGPSIPLEQRVPYYLGLSTICITSAVIATAAGYQLAGTLPRMLTLGLVFLNPMFFLMVMAAVVQRAAVMAILSGAVLGPLLHLATPEWGLPLTGIIAGSLAFLVDQRMEKHG